RVVTAGVNQTVNEGSAVNLTGIVNDPNPANGSNFSYLWQVVANNGQAVPNGTTPTFTFTPRDNGLYTVTLRITDNDDGARQYNDTITVTVSNVAPVVVVGSNATIVTGTNFARSGSFVDPGTDTWTATVDYGDGSGVQSLTLNADNSFGFSH